MFHTCPILHLTKPVFVICHCFQSILIQMLLLRRVFKASSEAAAYLLITISYVPWIIVFISWHWYITKSLSFYFTLHSIHVIIWIYAPPSKHHYLFPVFWHPSPSVISFTFHPLHPSFATEKMLVSFQLHTTLCCCNSWMFASYVIKGFCDLK